MGRLAVSRLGAGHRVEFLAGVTPQHACGEGHADGRRGPQGRPPTPRAHPARAPRCVRPFPRGSAPTGVSLPHTPPPGPCPSSPQDPPCLPVPVTLVPAHGRPRVRRKARKTVISRCLALDGSRTTIKACCHRRRACTARGRLHPPAPPRPAPAPPSSLHPCDSSRPSRGHPTGRLQVRAWAPSGMFPREHPFPASRPARGGPAGIGEARQAAAPSPPTWSLWRLNLEAEPSRNGACAAGASGPEPRPQGALPAGPALNAKARLLPGRKGMRYGGHGGT